MWSRYVKSDPTTGHWFLSEGERKICKIVVHQQYVAADSQNDIAILHVNFWLFPSFTAFPPFPTLFYLSTTQMWSFFMLYYHIFYWYSSVFLICPPFFDYFSRWKVNFPKLDNTNYHHMTLKTMRCVVQIVSNIYLHFTSLKMIYRISIENLPKFFSKFNSNTRSTCCFERLNWWLLQTNSSKWFFCEYSTGWIWRLVCKSQFLFFSSFICVRMTLINKKLWNIGLFGSWIAT